MCSLNCLVAHVYGLILLTECNGGIHLQVKTNNQGQGHDPGSRSGHKWSYYRYAIFALYICCNISLWVSFDQGTHWNYFYGQNLLFQGELFWGKNGVIGQQPFKTHKPLKNGDIYLKFGLQICFFLINLVRDLVWMDFRDQSPSLSRACCVDPDPYHPIAQFLFNGRIFVESLTCRKYSTRSPLVQDRHLLASCQLAFHV